MLLAGDVNTDLFAGVELGVADPAVVLETVRGSGTKQNNKVVDFKLASSSIKPGWLYTAERTCHTLCHRNRIGCVLVS